jgi:molybdopterin-containing oxidoreductase family membrane subunit
VLARIVGRPVELDARTAWRAVRHELANQPRSLRLWLGFLGLLMLFGAWGALMTLPSGTEVFGTTPAAEWGLLIAAYVFFAVTTSGLCLASSLGTVFGIELFRPLEKRHAILAVLCLTTAFGVIALDLHYPFRLLFGVVLSPSPTSPMWWMGVLYAGYMGFLLCEVFTMFTGRDRAHLMFCTLASIMAIIAPSTLGAVFGVLFSHAFWYGIFAPLYLVGTALLSGCALLGIAFYFVDRFRLSGYGDGSDRAIRAIRLLLTLGLVLAVFFLARQVIAGISSTDPGLHEGTVAWLTGPLALPFWLVRVLAGLVAPLVILFVPTRRPARRLLAASLLAFVGIFADRLLFVGAGQIAATTTASGIASAPWVEYSPSLVEIAIVVGASAFIAFFYTLAERYLDLSEHVIHGKHKVSATATVAVPVAVECHTVRCLETVARHRRRAGPHPDIALQEVRA